MSRENYDLNKKFGMYKNNSCQCKKSPREKLFKGELKNEITSYLSYSANLKIGDIAFAKPRHAV